MRRRAVAILSALVLVLSIVGTSGAASGGGGSHGGGGGGHGAGGWHGGGQRHGGGHWHGHGYYGGCCWWGSVYVAPYPAPFPYYPSWGYYGGAPYPRYEAPVVSTPTAGAYEPPAIAREVVFPMGKYVLYGDGLTQPWQWVWFPAAPPPPAPH